MELEVDAKEVVQRAVAEARPGEDLDEAILRACKALYPEQHMEVFSAVGHMAEAMARQTGTSKAEAVRELAASEGSATISMSTTTTVSETVHSESDGTPTSLDELPPALQEKVRRAVARGEGSVTIEREFTVGSGSGAGSQAVFRCRKCGFTEPGDFERCPHCGAGKRRGLLGWLFGR